VLYCQGRYEEAEATHQQALETKAKVLGHKHPGTPISINNFGLVLASQGKYKKANIMAFIGKR
jgi:Tfp pilus assembly protein PilF